MTREVKVMLEKQGYKLLGIGQNVFSSDAVTEGPVKYVREPIDVIKLSGAPDLKETIVVARGGTTTFLAPLLAGGVKGIITSEGSPFSHLGILSREFGTPCIMTLQVKKDNDFVPLLDQPIEDGTVVMMDISDPEEGRVYVKEG